MTAVRARKSAKSIRNLGLLASASIMSLMMAGEAQAACTPSQPQPLNNITIDTTFVDCNGANTGQTIIVNAASTQVEVNGAGDTLDNSNVTFNGDSHIFTVYNGASLTNTTITANGMGNNVVIGAMGVGIGTANNFALSLNGDGGSLLIGSGSTVTANPGSLQFINTGANSQNIFVSGTLAALANSGGNFLITGGAGTQSLNLSGTLTVQPNGLAFSGGADADFVTIQANAVVNGGTGNNFLFDGGSGDDRFAILGGGTRAFNTANFEILTLQPGSGNTLFLGGSGDYNSISIGGGTVEVANDAALGQSNSSILLSNGARLRLNPSAAFTFSHSLSSGSVSTAVVEQTGQTITYNGLASASNPWAGNFLISGGTAIINSGGQFGTGTITNNSALQLTNIALNNNISGTGTVTKVGPGVGTLGGVNTYTGGTLISSGTLAVTNGSAVGSGAVNIAGGANFELNFATDQTFGNNMAGAGSLIKSGVGIATLTGTNTFSGGTSLLEGGIRVTDLSQLGTGPITSNSNTQLIYNYNGAAAQTLTAPIFTGAGRFVKEGTGELVMDTSNAYTGGTQIDGGVVRVALGDSLGSGDIVINNGAALAISNVATDPTIANNITGNGTILIDDNGGAQFSGNNLGFTGTFIVSGNNFLYIEDGVALGNGTVSLATVGALLDIDNATDTVVSANITGAGYIQKDGIGRLTLTGTNTLSNSSVIVSQGTLQIEGTQNIGTGTEIDLFAGTTLDLSTNQNTTLSNNIIRDGRVVKTGTGTVFLTGANTYTGGTDIQQGAIRVTDTSFLGTGAITVQAGAALDLSIAGSQTLNQSVTGAGILRKSDTGDLTLLSNGLTGGVDIVGGRVIVNTANALGGGPVTTAADTQLVFDNNTTEVMSNLISGAGALTKDGTGLLVIQNANSYTGGTIINAGRLGLNNGQGLGTGDVIVLQNAILGIGNVNVANNISGAGSVIKTASGVGSLTGTNTFSGGLDIQDGAVIADAPDALGTGTVSMASGTTLQVSYNGTVNAAMANLLTGAGTFIKDGTGTVVMNSGGNTYTGGTLVNQGRLVLNFGDALGTGVVQINSGAELGIGGITLNNNVQGAGRIVKTGGLAATLTGTNTHSGGIDIQGGAIDVTGNSALGTGAISIASGAALNYTNANAATFSNGLSGAGSFNKLGAGQLTFANNFSIGSLNLNAGRTRINSIATGNVTVAANATLDGTGRIIGNLTNNGTVAPGNSIGTMTVQGNYVHNSGATLEVEFDGAGNIDLLEVTGNATINGGTIRFVSIGGAEGQGGTFLRTGGTLTGTFANVVTSGALLPLSVVYEPNRAFMAPSVLTARPSTFNAQSMAAADTALGFIDSIGVGDVRHGNGNRIWLSGFGAWGKRSASGTTLAYDHDSRGMSGGINFDVGGSVTLGTAIGWAKGDITLGANGGGGDQSSVLGSLTARYSGTGVTVGGGLLLGKVDQDTLRNVAFNGFSGSVDGETDSKLFGAFAELGLPLGSTGSWAFSANARGSYVRQKQDGYTESGTSPLRLRLGDLTTSTMEGQAHLTAKTSLWNRANGGEETPEGLDLRIDLGGRYLGTLGDREIPVVFAVSNAGIVLQGDTRNTLQGMTGLALDYTTRSGAIFSFGYRGEFGKTDRHAVQAGVSFAF